MVKYVDGTNNMNTKLTQKAGLRDCLLRLLDQSYGFNSHHLGSAFSSLPLILEIYARMNKVDKFILSSGHAAAALYVVLEKQIGIDSSILFEKMGEHPHRNTELGVDCSSGSLGMGLSVAVGMALANEHKNVFCLVSDGECAEGVFWESIRFIKQRKVSNLFVYVNINGWSGYDKIDSEELSKEIKSVNSMIQVRFTNNYPFEDFGLSAHYMNLTKEMYDKSRERICEDNL
jgi:transketolase N-terminal domain/subunit